MNVDLPRVTLHTDGPTPVRELRPGLWLKDEGAFGSGGWGGNKVRKLEWILGAAQARRRKRILTVGGRGTNWGLATALYGRALGIKTILALVDQPMDGHVMAQFERIRNSGARVHLTHTPRRTRLVLPWLWLRHGRPWLLPPGGSTPLGAVGYVVAGLEIGEQVRAGALPEPDHVVVAVGSGGTAAGLIVGLQAAGLRSRVLGVVVNDGLRLDADRIALLAQRCARLLRKHGAELPVLALSEDAFDLTRDYLGGGYGHPLAGAPEGYDPVYTAKAMAAALALDGTVLFVHTDGPR
jgi:D-cysteine desulfhydrase